MALSGCVLQTASPLVFEAQQFPYDCSCVAVI
jgi:hypothetical protein